MTTMLERTGGYRAGVRKVLLVLFVLAVCTVSGSGGQWSRQPGDRVRDAFGPTGGSCRGACGMGCPTASCAATVSYECAAPDRLRRVRTFVCGTHQGCRDHDDCLDRCRMRQEQGLDCEAQCHTEAIETYGFETATSWGRGGGPFDTQRITFEYTRTSPDEPEPLFSCPAGARLSCGSAAAGRCLSSAGAEVTPVFESYSGGTRGMRVSGFRSGRVCRDGDTASGVCEPAVDVDVRGESAWYGFEFDYANADPSVPLLCSSSGAEDDFMGSVVKSMLTFAPANDRTDLGKALGQIQHQLGRGRSLTDVLSGVKVRPAGQPAPVAEATAAPGVPSSVRIPSASGHLLVPMFELSDGAAPGATLLREVRCTHNGSPVLETTFRLHFRGR